MTSLLFCQWLLRVTSRYQEHNKTEGQGCRCLHRTAMWMLQLSRSRHWNGSMARPGFSFLSLLPRFLFLLLQCLCTVLTGGAAGLIVSWDLWVHRKCASLVCVYLVVISKGLIFQSDRSEPNVELRTIIVTWRLIGGWKVQANRSTELIKTVRCYCLSVFTPPPHAGLSHFFTRPCMMSMGRGNMIVEFFSADMVLRVCR